jgi:hypothetical protein
METSNHKEANDSPPSDQFADAEPVTAAAADTKDITPVERRGRDHHKRPREEEIIVPTNDVQVVVEPHKEETQDATMTQPPAAKRVKKNTDGAAVDADVTVEVDPAVQQVEIIVEKSDAETETRHDDNDEAKDENNAGKVFSPAVTRSRRTKRRSSNSEREGDDDRDSNMEDAANDNDKENSAASATNDDDNDGNDKEDKPTRRWRGECFLRDDFHSLSFLTDHSTHHHHRHQSTKWQKIMLILWVRSCIQLPKWGRMVTIHCKENTPWKAFPF